MNNNVTLIAAFMGGVVSFFSPCVLPLVPVYFSYLVSNVEEKTSRLLLVRALGFIIGFSAVFIALGASASVLGQVFNAKKAVIRELSGLTMIFFGLNMVGILRIGWLHREGRFGYGPQKTTSLASSILLGVIFAAGWTPCIGPILASILVYAGSTATLYQGVQLLIFYSLGLGLPFFVAAILTNKFGHKLSRLNRFLPYVTKVSGVLMIIFGYMVFYNKVGLLNSYFSRFQF